MNEPSPDAPQELSSPTAVEPAEDAVGSAGERIQRSRSPYIGVGAIAIYAALAATAAWTLVTPLLVLLAASQLVDLLVVRDSYIRAAFARAQYGIATRSLARELSTAIVVAGAGWAAAGTRHAAALCVVGLAGLRLLYQLLLVPIRRRAATPVETRNIDLEGLRLPRYPHPLQVTRISERSHALTLVGLLGAAVGMRIGHPSVVFVTVGCVLAAELVAVVLAIRLVLGNLRTLRRDDLVAAIQARVAALRPEVMLYHSGDADSIYQANMWLSTVERLPRSSVILLRERASMPLLAPTTTPVLCIPGSVDFMTFGLRDIRVAMYTANVGKTIHMIREPGVCHAFIGHGDSDKTSSSNPFAKVYSQIWVAGVAGRDRYRKANLGIHDEEIVEVGRPQLSTIETYAGSPTGVLTVLYAPTWEGWTNDPTHTSMIRTGPPLAERLVALPGVRFVYKPHPLAGSVSRAAARADAAIRATVARANAAGGEHQVVVGPEPGLYDCFNAADVLVGDISSVLSDFIASYKPYVVTNLTPLGEDEFRAAYPSASAAYLISPTADEIAAVLELVRGSDPLAGQRKELKEYLLGPDEPDAMTRFTTAVDAAYDWAVATWPQRPTPAAIAL